MRSLCCAMALCLLFVGKGWTEERSLLCTLEEEIAAILEDNRQSVVRIHTLYPPVRGQIAGRLVRCLPMARGLFLILRVIF